MWNRHETEQSGAPGSICSQLNIAKVRSDTLRAQPARCTDSGTAFVEFVGLPRERNPSTVQRDPDRSGCDMDATATLPIHRPVLVREVGIADGRVHLVGAESNRLGADVVARFVQVAASKNRGPHKQTKIDCDSLWAI